jgi:hypothetical protein
MSSCCGGNADTLLKAKKAIEMANGELPTAGDTPAPQKESGIVEPSVVRLKFVGANKGAIPYQGRISGQTYYGGDNIYDKYADCDPRDVEHLVSLGVWQPVAQPRQVAVAPRIEAQSPQAPALPTSNGIERPMLDLTDDMASEEAVNRAAAELTRQTRKKQ